MKDWTLDRPYQWRQDERKRILEAKRTTPKGQHSLTYDPKALKKQFR